jgi:hypothetical protein
MIMMMSRHGHLACDAIVSGRLHTQRVRERGVGRFSAAPFVRITWYS